MAASCGIELKNIIYEPGEERQGVSGEIHLDGGKIGEVFDDGWCEELYIEFESMKFEEIFLKRKEKYYKQKNSENLTAEEFIRSLIYRDRIKLLSRKEKKTKKLPEQLSFLQGEW